MPKENSRLSYGVTSPTGVPFSFAAVQSFHLCTSHCLVVRELYMFHLHFIHVVSLTIARIHPHLKDRTFYHSKQQKFIILVQGSAQINLAGTATSRATSTCCTRLRASLGGSNRSSVVCGHSPASLACKLLPHQGQAHSLNLQRDMKNSPLPDQAQYRRLIHLQPCLFNPVLKHKEKSKNQKLRYTSRGQYIILYLILI